VHGDLHPGQFIRDRRGQVWLIDLDDLALGPPEVDFGNLAACLATRRPGPLHEMARHAIAGVVAETPSANPALVAHFCEIALLRRALKLRERGLDWVFRQLLLVP
jgi:aminoglycoside phosphotransferase (APT) family kinase protein